MENVDIVAPVNSAWDGLGVQADERHGEGDQGWAITRKVGEMGSGVTGQEVKDIVMREDLNAMD